MATRKHPNIYPYRRQDGKEVYRTMLSFRDPATGRRKQKMVTFLTVREAKDALAKNRADAARGQDAAPSQLTVAELLDEWLERKRPPGTKPSTFAAYEGSCRRYIRPQLGHYRLERVTERVIEGHYRALRKSGVGPHAVRYVHARLADMLRYARRQRLIATNPMDNVEAPHTEEHEASVWDDEEIERFLAHADGSQFGPIWTLALFTGLRRGELCGLRWADVDEAAGVIKVRQQISRYGTGRLTGAPKYGSRRQVSVPPHIFRLLRQHHSTQNERRLAAGEAWTDHGLVFANSHGEPAADSSLRYDLNSLIARAKVPALRIHDLRHTHGSLLIRRGKSVKEVQQRLGHKHASLTMDTYLHAVPDEHRQTAEDLARWLA